MFDYCLLTAGTSLNRAPSEQRLAAGDIISLDCGGNYKGYIGDLCRMGIVGKPDAELEDLLGWSRRCSRRHASRSRRRARRRHHCARRDDGARVAARHIHPLHGARHGARQPRGAAADEHPRLSYTGYDADRPLETGMVISIETTMGHPKRGFVKLEDTVVVTADGWEAFGDGARGWNKAGE